MDRVALVHSSPDFKQQSASAPPARLEITRGDATLYALIHANRDLMAGGHVARLIVVIQGDRRRPVDYLQAVANSAGAARSTAAAVDDDSLVLAPSFRVAGELAGEEKLEGAAYWSSSGWKEGGLSGAGIWERAWRVSSFAVVDALITAVVSGRLWTGITEVLIVGHSAGGQFVQRFAAGSRIDESLVDYRLRFRFVVANPSSYLYLNRDRFLDGTGTFQPLTDEQLDACPRANRYKYGLHGLNEYMAASNRATIRRRYEGRSIDYVVGELDTDQEDSRFDATCAAQLQGRTRYQRGRTFHAYLAHHFGSEVHARHRLLVVPGVGHDVRGIFAAPIVHDAMFGEPAGAPIVG